MKITKRQLKRIIREEYSRLKRKGLIKEYGQQGNWQEEEINQLMEDWIAANPDASPEETMQEYYRLSGEIRGF